jgi:hypothetical protein
MRYIDPYFRHISILRKSDDGKDWLLADVSGGNLILDSFPCCSLRRIYGNAVIISMWSKPVLKPTARIWHLNCVELAKQFLGITAPFIFTPFQLYRHIEKVKGDSHG